MYAGIFGAIRALQNARIGSSETGNNQWCQRMSRDDYSKEEKILQMMRKVLTDVAKDTYTKPGLKHPLSEDTIISIRDCLGLIASREKELADEAGRPSEKRPRYIDEPQKSVVIPLDRTGLKKNKPVDPENK